jgi:multicomponent Na+:H+ antiporter subunit E
MGELLVVLSIALVWSLLFSELSLFNLTMGAIIGVFALGLIERNQPQNLSLRLLAFIRYVWQFFKELAMANFTIARLAISPQVRIYPHIIAVPLRVQSDAAITLLAFTITLLPGTIAMGVSEDKSLLYAHAIGEADLNKAINSVTRMETYILGFMR